MGNGRARRDMPLRGETILVAGQRCLVDTLDPPAGSGLTPGTYTVWITRRTHRSGAVRVWAHDIDVEPSSAVRRR